MTNSLLQWIIFASTLFLAMSLPGPGVLATISKSLRFGRARTTWFVTGASLGDLAFLWVALLGLGSLIETNEFWFSVLTLVLGMYFIATGLAGIVQLKEMKRSISHFKSVEKAQKTQLHIEGFLLTISNPKVAIFYVGLLPSLLNVTAMTRKDYVLVSILTPCLLFGVLSAYALIAEKAQGFWANSATRRRFNYLSAFIMVSIGSLLIFKSGAIGMLVENLSI